MDLRSEFNTPRQQFKAGDKVRVRHVVLSSWNSFSGRENESQYELLGEPYRNGNGNDVWTLSGAGGQASEQWFELDPEPLEKYEKPVKHPYSSTHGFNRIPKQKPVDNVTVTVIHLPEVIGRKFRGRK